jgi:hypothetical protein
VQVKGICNIFNKISGNVTNLEKKLSIQEQEAPIIPTDLTKIELPHSILSLTHLGQRTEKEY